MSDTSGVPASSRSATSEGGDLVIRPVGPDDAQAIWRILEPIIRAGETYALPTNMSREGALGYWVAADHDVFVATCGPTVVGTYFLQPNQRGGGAHVANCGYATAATATGRGVARAMCTHSLAHARRRGFRGMQFNFVVGTNERAIRLWQYMGFAVVGRLPRAFLHPTLGYVNALVMYRDLVEQ